jgi:alpha-tubulin suppressor-like RCC1 family protein
MHRFAIFTAIVALLGACDDDADQNQRTALDAGIPADAGGASDAGATPDGAPAPPDAARLEAIAAGGGHTCAIGEDGRVYCWGTMSGATGHAALFDEHTGWTALDSGGDHSCALRDGQLWCWGANGLYGFPAAPTQVGAANDWTQVSAGLDATCGLRAEGTLWCWRGTSLPAQVGAANDWTRVSSGGDHACGVRGAGTLWCWSLEGTGEATPEAIGADDDWTVIAAGTSHDCGVRANGTLWCWGTNARGQLGAPQAVAEASAPRQVGGDEDWASVDVGDAYSCARKQDGALYCFGDSTFGQVGDGEQGAIFLPRRSGGAGSTWRSISAGTWHVCGVRSDGTGWCWGRNHAGTLGDGEAPSAATPRRLGDRSDWTQVASFDTHACARRSDGSLWCWGDNTDGALGTGDDHWAAAPRRVGDADDWSRVAVGATHTCGLRGVGTLWCWGGGTGAGAGAGSSVPVRVDTRDDWIDLAAGQELTCARRADRSLWCWGSNLSGELGSGGEEDARTTPTRVGAGTDWEEISVDAGRACGRRAGTLYCWGAGFGATPVALDGSGTAFVEVNARDEVCAVGASGGLFCWSATDVKMRRVGAEADDDWRAVDGRCGLRSGGSVWCGVGDPLPALPEPQAEASGFAELASSPQALCGVKDDGSLWCWGLGQFGQLGHGDAWALVPVGVQLP